MGPGRDERSWGIRVPSHHHLRCGLIKERIVSSCTVVSCWKSSDVISVVRVA